MKNKLYCLLAASVLVLLAACGGGSANNSNSNNSVANNGSTAAATLAPAATIASSDSSAATSPSTVSDASSADTSAPTAQPTARTAATDEPTDAAQAATAPTTQTAASGSSSGGGAGVPIAGTMGDVLKKACDALSAQPNVIIHTSLTGIQSGDTLIQFEGADKFSMNVTLDGKTTAMAVISPTTYMQEDGKWQKRTDPNGALVVMGLIRPAATAYICLDALGDDTDSEAFKLGQLTANLALPDVVDGAPTLTYTANATFENEETGKGSGTIKYWLDAVGSLPRKVTIDYKTDKGNGSGVVTFKYETPNITPPIQ